MYVLKKRKKIVPSENRDYFSEASGAAFGEGGGACARGAQGAGEVGIDVTRASQSRSTSPLEFDLAAGGLALSPLRALAV